MRPRRPMARPSRTSIREVIANYDTPDDLPDGLRRVYDARINGPHPYYTKADLAARKDQPSLTGIIVD